MQHFPASKGDSLCPLGFHPQVRWPTRCKRCFRDYKEHYNRKKEENDVLRKDSITASSPSISNSFTSKSDYPRSWASSDNLYEGKLENELTEYKSTLDLVNLDDNSSNVTTVNLRLPKRRSYTSIDQTGKDNETEKDKNKNSTSENGKKEEKDLHRIQIKEMKKNPNRTPTEGIVENNLAHSEVNDVDRLNADLKKKLEATQNELEATKQKCDRLEKEKRDVILRRLPSMDSSNKSNFEYNKLQQKHNELQKEVNQYKEEKSTLQVKIRILEEEIKRYPKGHDRNSSNVEDLISKLKATELFCEELMDENECLKKELREMEEQVEEMQDNFREDQLAEYADLKKQVEMHTKNCRILSFKLRKAEKRNDQYEIEKQELEKQLKEFSENQANAYSLEKIKKLEQELADSANVSTKLQNELGVLNEKLSEYESVKIDKKGTKTTEVKRISRQSLIRSGSQEEPIIQAQVPDTSEIERDLREQLKFSEEEVQNLRKMISRLENENEVLLQQMKKVTAHLRNKPGAPIDLIDDEELKLQLELTEQEIAPMKSKNDLEKPLSKLQGTSKKVSEEKANKKLLEYEQQLKELKANIEEEKSKVKQKQTELTKSAKKWENESKKFKTEIEYLEQANKNLNESIKNNEATITKLEKKISTNKAVLRSAQQAEKEKLKVELDQKKTELEALQNDLISVKSHSEELSKQLKDLISEKTNSDELNDKKIKQLETDLKGEKKKAELLKKESEARNSELRTLKLQISKKDTSAETKFQSKIDELTEVNNKLTTNLKETETKFKDLIAKHEDLEEEFSLTRAKMDVEKETMNSELQTIKQRLNNMISEKRELEEEFEKDKNKWFTEKKKLQENCKSVGTNGESNDLDKKRFNSLIAEKQSELDKYKKENESLSYQIDYMKRESDEIKRKLDDYEKVNKVQRNISADTSVMDKEIREMKKKVEMIEKAKKAEVLKCKMGFEEQLATVNNELKLLHSQTIRFKKERDTYKNMLQSAQKSMGDLKYRRDVTSKQENGSVKTENLEAQLSTLEDEIAETKLECSKLKTRLVSDKSNYEVRIIEMQTRINELEEEKILNSGRTKIAGLRTRMELSWQKEREEQQRLLQETATLARDLRQTLFEVEKERDKERLEAKRKLEQLRKAVEEEQLEAKKKVKDLQCDLLELRDAHAKLRTTNERLKREKDRLRRDEDVRAKSLSRTNLSESRDSIVLQHIETLKCLANEVEILDEKQRGKLVTPEDKKDKLDNVVSSLLLISQELLSQMKEIEMDKLMMPRRRMRSDVNTESSTRLSRQGSLKRRSLSLEQTSVVPREQNIWQNDQGSMTSLRSANSDLDMYGNMSDTSVQSDTAEKKKKKGIIGKLRKMTKSKSVDEGDSGILSSLIGKKPSSLENLNNAISGMFRRGGSSSRSNSMERTKPPDQKYDSSSRQRPLMKMKSESPAR
ncbi:early endosome antigen 1-like isoform X2 [Harmonia axyridis]|uniref:early endosome antigen 1-like isoform X2 n=1 Tax=Harmonia axyridis TaxID=115357 RepID=UPI001E278D9A|nr:early endosome antigen 1-like isoform X2 [Harmonia axyridis]